jgi:hypothetical protein
VSKEEALQYLELRKIDKEQAAQIYELVGGRMLHLKNTADKIKRGGTLEGMCTACYAENSVSFSLPLQLCARRCSPTSKVNSCPLKLLLNIVITKTEPRLYVNF